MCDFRVLNIHLNLRQIYLSINLPIALVYPACCYDKPTLHSRASRDPAQEALLGPQPLQFHQVKTQPK